MEKGILTALMPRDNMDQGDGEAYYNRVVAASLNELLVRQYAIEKWNGELPTYNGGGMTPFINVK